jgi:hypothetical protein
VWVQTSYHAKLVLQALQIASHDGLRYDLGPEVVAYSRSGVLQMDRARTSTVPQVATMRLGLKYVYRGFRLIYGPERQS